MTPNPTLQRLADISHTLHLWARDLPDSNDLLCAEIARQEHRIQQQFYYLAELVSPIFRDFTSTRDLRPERNSIEPPSLTPSEP